MKIIKILFCLIFFTVCNGYAASIISPSDERVVSLSFRNTSFADVVVQVSERLRFSIKYDAAWKDLIVSGEFENVPVETFFRRVLKGKNIIIESQDANRELVVKFFGDKSSRFVVANYSAAGGDVGRLSKSIDPVTGKTMSELNAIYELQIKKHQKRLQNPDAIDPMTGKTMAEVNEVLRKQKQNRQMRENDPGAIDPMTGKTVGELQQIFEQQKQNLADRQQNLHDLDPMTGKTRAELDSILDVQAQNRAARLNNPEAIDPMTGKTMAEINAILKKQKENLNRRLGE